MRMALDRTFTIDAVRLTGALIALPFSDLLVIWIGRLRLCQFHWHRLDFMSDAALGSLEHSTLRCSGWTIRLQLSQSLATPAKSESAIIIKATRDRDFRRRMALTRVMHIALWLEYETDSLMARAK